MRWKLQTEVLLENIEYEQAEGTRASVLLLVEEALRKFYRVGKQSEGFGDD